nr:MAG TPA: hypothetical protein [Caudoviricetes sp.]
MGHSNYLPRHLPAPPRAKPGRGVGGAGGLGKKSDLCHGRAAATAKRAFTKLHQMTR